VNLSVAIHLIRQAIPSHTEPQRWADLGAGSGMFTKALGSLLLPSSQIIAVDQSSAPLKSIEWGYKSVGLQSIVGNFSDLNFGENFDGILMANSLHYVPDALGFIDELKTKLLPSGRLVVVEYERRHANAWVPYPINFKTLREIGEKAGFSVSKFHEVPSAYDSATIYSAALSIR